LDDSISYSDETYQLDTRATVSALRDTVRALLGPEKIAERLGTIKAAAARQVDPRQALALLSKLTKAEQKDVIETFTTADIVAVPAGQSAYRLSNALSWVANATEDRGRALEMERLAGDLLLRGAGKAPAETSAIAN
jgi:ribosomal protein L12E/L44/L45/RPP1/RPP2